MSYVYPKHDPKWSQATRVVAATPDGSHVNVTSNHGEFTMQEVTYHNKFGDTSKGNIVVEIAGRGWFCVWFNMADIEPYEAGEW